MTEVPAAVREALGVFYGGFASENETLDTIGKMWLNEGYMMDTHTAVAYKVYRDYVRETGDAETPTVIASTASAYKFAESVSAACGIGPCNDGFEYVAELAAATGIEIPYGLRDLDKKTVLHEGIVDADKMMDAVSEALR